MIRYTVKYRLNGQWFFRKIKNVTGDAIMPENPNMRIFFLEDETRIELPLIGSEIFYSKERAETVRRNMQKESGLKVV